MTTCRCGGLRPAIVRIPYLRQGLRQAIFSCGGNAALRRRIFLPHTANSSLTRFPNAQQSGVATASLDGGAIFDPKLTAIFEPGAGGGRTW